MRNNFEPLKFTKEQLINKIREAGYIVPDDNRDIYIEVQDKDYRDARITVKYYPDAVSVEYGRELRRLPVILKKIEEAVWRRVRGIQENQSKRSLRELGESLKNSFLWPEGLITVSGSGVSQGNIYFNLVAIINANDSLGENKLTCELPHLELDKYYSDWDNKFIVSYNKEGIVGFSANVKLIDTLPMMEEILKRLQDNFLMASI